MKPSIFLLICLVVICSNLPAHAKLTVPDYTIHYSQVLLDGELGSEAAVFIAPKFSQKWQYQFGIQEFDRYNYSELVNVENESVSQATLAAAFEYPFDQDIMIKPIAGMTINLADHTQSNTQVGALGLFAGVDFNYQLIDHVNLTFGLKHFVMHDILSGTGVGFGIEVSPSRNRQILKLMNCKRCYSIFVGSYRDKRRANLAITTEELSQHPIFQKRHLANVELYLGQFDSYQQAVAYKRRNNIRGSVIKLGTF